MKVGFDSSARQMDEERGPQHLRDGNDVASERGARHQLGEYDRQTAEYPA